MSDEVAQFDADDRPRPEAEMAELSSVSGPKLHLSSLPASLSAVLSKLDSNGDGFVDVNEVKSCLSTVDSIEKGRIPIRALPPDLQAKFLQIRPLAPVVHARAAGTNQVLPINPEPNNMLDCDELFEAFKTLEAQSHSKSQGTISFDAFPENIQEELKEFDLSGDGKLDAKEIIAGMQALHAEKRKTRNLVFLIIGLVVLMCILLTAIFGLLVAVIEMTRESKIGSSGVMLVKGTNDPVRVASTDFTVINGVLSARNSKSNQTCGGGVCPSDPIKVTEATHQMKFSSEVDDETLYELKNLRIEQGRSFVYFQVLAVARYAEAYSRHGSVVVIYTHLGEITLDGDAVSFHETLSGAFSRAGFAIDTNGRRLLGVVEMLGLFKMIRGSAANASAGANTTTMQVQPSGELPVALPATYYAEVTETDLCQNEQGASSNECEYEGRLVDWATEVTNGQKALVLREVQVYDGVNYHCAMEKDASLLAALSARRALDNPTGGNMSVAYKGFATVEGVYCRSFDVTVNSEGIETKLRIYEDHAKRRLFQLQVANLRWRFDVLTPIANEAANPLTSADLDMEAILRSCDPPDRFAPARFVEGYVSNIVQPQPEWGAPSNTSRRRNGPSESDGSDSDPIIMSMDDYRAWRAATALAHNESVGDGGRRAVSAAACKGNRGVYNSFTFPPDASFRSTAELKSGRYRGGQGAPSVFIAYESCSDEISLFLAGSAGMGCPSVSGGIELALSGMATGKPNIGVDGFLIASVNVCSCPPFYMPSNLVPSCPTISVGIRAYLDNDGLAESRTCQVGSFPRGNLRLAGSAEIRVGSVVSVNLKVMAQMYIGFRCASQQRAGSKLKIGHRYQVEVKGQFLGMMKVWVWPIYPTYQAGCNSQTNALTGNPEYVFKPSTDEFAFALFEFGPSCSKS